MADHDLTINQDGMFGQLENLLSERETQLLQENEQELEGEQEPETEENEEQEEEEEEEEEQEQEDENGQEQEQEKKQEKENVDASVVADRWPGWPGESVFRMLVPSQKVGGIIGRKGEFIKKMCEEAKARIKILDGPAGTPERAVMVSAKEEPDLSLPPAVDGLLKVHKRVVDGLDDSSHAPASGVKVTTRLLVPAGQAGNLIGKQGTTVKSIQEKSDCIVRITEDLPTFALQDDRIVEVVGEPTAVHKAVELVALHLRKFLVDRSIIPIFEMQMQNPPPPPQMEHAPPPTQSWGPPPFAPNVPGPNYRGASTPSYRAHTHYAPPQQQQQHNSYYQPAELLPPPLEKQPHQGISAYGREAPLSSNNQPPQSMSTQVLQQIQIPLSYADAVIGNAGGTISYIRRASGATVTIQETRGVPGEMTVEITGNASQVQTAQQLIQNYIADAQAQPSAATADQTYNPYAAAAPTPTLGGSAYATQTGNPSLGGGYGSVYGTNYGY